jgi:mRNA-degrading endonuclease toxin of MazEF toxin-antitoxin module
MVKNFIGWIYKKISIDKLQKNNLTISEGQVFWCTLGENIGFEQNGKGEYFQRPVLIFKKFNNDIFWGIPMSTKIKDNKYYIKVLLKDVYQSAMISQLRILDSKRLYQFIGYISKKDFKNIQEKVIELIKCKSES